MDEHVTQTGTNGAQQDRPTRGRWIALEGPDGGGKTLQIPRLVARLEAAGIKVAKSPATIGETLLSVIGVGAGRA